MRLRIWPWLLLSLFSPDAAHAQAPLQYSADVSMQLGSHFGADNDFFLGAPSASARVVLGDLPEGVDVDALQIDANYDVLLSLDIGATLGGIVANPGDVVLRRAGTYSLAFDASASGVPERVNCDAVARTPAGLLLLSFDVGFVAAGAFIRPADVVSFNGSSFVKVIDSQALGLPTRLNIDAVHAESATVLLVSFQNGGSVAGLVFADEDILSLDLGGPIWSMRHAMLTTSARWGAANLDALSAAPVGDGLFKNGFE